MGSSFLFSPPIVTGAVILFMVGLAVRSVLRYFPRAAEARSRLKHLNRDLAKWDTPNAEKRRAVAALDNKIAAFREVEVSLRAYFEKLQAIEIEADKKQLAQKPAGAPKRKLEITLKKKGLE
jgi:hypothetical protein